MAARSVFVVGDSLFADALKQTLTDNSVDIMGSAPTPEAALPLLAACCPDAVILANASAESAPPAVLGQFLAAYPDLPIICANLSANVIRVVASQRVGTHRSDLLAAISALPKRS
jgi:chemotaxis response regulator CheB